MTHTDRLNGAASSVVKSHSQDVSTLIAPINTTQGETARLHYLKADAPLSVQKGILLLHGYLYLVGNSPKFDWINHLVNELKLGDLMPQYNGESIYDVKRVAGYEAYSDSKSQNDLPIHNDGTYLRVPPKYLALRCEQPATCGGGHTCLADGIALIESLPEQTQQELMIRQFDWSYKFGNLAGRQGKFPAPILDISSENSLMLRYSDNNLRYGDSSPNLHSAEYQKAWDSDDFLKTVCDYFADYYQKNHVAICMEKYSLLVWDNHRMVHGRTAYSDPARHLQRVWLS